MAMNPRTHPRGARPDFSMEGLPPNPRPDRITNAMWWLVQMRLRLEPTSRNGGTYVNKPGYHNAGENLPDHGLGNSNTDHSIRWSYDREGPWWEEFCAAHDWTFENAHQGDYSEISLYTSRLIRAMKDPNDPRPDDVYAYTIGQADGDLVVEGYHERTDEEITGDVSHLWHRHDGFRRNIIGLFLKMWQALTIDMGWSVNEWRMSIQPEEDMDQETKTYIDNKFKALTVLLTFTDAAGGVGSPVGNAVLGHGYPLVDGGPRTAFYKNLQVLHADMAAVKGDVETIKETLQNPTPPTA